MSDRGEMLPPDKVPPDTGGAGSVVSVGVDTEAERPEGRFVSDGEKYLYADAKRLPMAVLGALSSLLLLIGLWRFTLHEYLFFAVPFVLMNGLYLFLSYGIMLSGSSFDLTARQAVLREVWRARKGTSDPSVDIFLPICGEDRKTILETWDAVRRVHWDGPLNVYVLDDSPTDGLRGEAESRGFHYLRRPSREFKKAGNIQNGFRQSSGEFILLLDADFSPRPDMLRELLPYLLADERVAIVQSPQFFDIHSRMGWVEAGAGYVQEFFYRLIQPARDRWGAAVCVGSCAVYRRLALEPLGGAALIEHSEDMWTGFEVTARGWKVKYVPIVLAKGTCPDSVAKFFTQQYRWCCGSLSLICHARFWTAPLSVAQKLCFVSGFVYYVATAFNILLVPLPPLVMVCFFPDSVHWHHLAFSILAVLYTPLILGIWSNHPFGFHFLTTREVSAAAHLVSVSDHCRGSLMPWVVTGERQPRVSNKLLSGLMALLIPSAAAFVLVWTFALLAIARDPERWVHFVPPLLFTSMHAAVCWRVWNRELAAQFGRAVRTKAGNVAEAVRGLTEVPRRRLAYGITGAAAGSFLLLLTFGAGKGSTFTSSPSYQGAAFPELSARIAEGGAPGPVQQVNFATPAALAASPPRRTLNAPRAVLPPPTRLQDFSPLVDVGPWTVEPAFPGADLQRGMRLREHPNQPGVFFLGEFSGLVQRIQFREGKWRTEPVADLRGTDLQWLYSIALHPRFPEVNRIYLTYRTKKEVRPQFYRLSAIDLGMELPAKPSAETILINQQVDNEEHLGGDLAFDSQGFLMLSVGDNALSHKDVNSQRIDGGLFSGILRIDVDRRGEGVSHPPPRAPVDGKTQGYFIPNDNPFVGQEGVLEEFWAIGFRNPFRISFDESSDRLWVGEVGQDRMEQVELAAPGTNHLWSFREGTLPYDGGYLKGVPPRRPIGTPVDPFFEYRHEDQNYCVVGGMVYWGEKFPELKGMYLFGDNQSCRVWAIDPLAPKQRKLLLQLPYTKAASSLVALETDREGNIYFVNFASYPLIYKLTRAKPLDLPSRLSETELFADLRSLAPAAGFVPYEVAVPLWSDGMHKQRWFRLPGGRKIDNRPPFETAWKFPAGTTLLKHFEQPAGAAGEAGKKLETRVLVVREDGRTVGATYLWNPEGTEAFLQTERKTLPVPDLVAAGGKGGPLEFEYHVPGHHDCVVCHNRTNPVLGITRLQLNRPSGAGSGQDNQLARFSRMGLFETPYPGTAAAGGVMADLPALAPAKQKEASLEYRARSYLHANCSACHFPQGLERVDLDFRMPASLPSSAIVDQPSKLQYVQIDGEYARKIIEPGQPKKSALYLRMRAHDRNVSMPYLGRTVPDAEALDLIAKWIESLPPPPVTPAAAPRP